jgi:CheY-like chemotaxis protein
MEQPMEAPTRNILIVDDEPENIRFLGRLLAGQGYRVHVADSGERALDTLDSIACEEPIDLILLDILMPDGIDGIETCRRVKSRQDMQRVPVIFLTEKDDRETMVQAFEAGGADYVSSPSTRTCCLRGSALTRSSRACPETWSRRWRSARGSCERPTRSCGA